MRIQQVASGSGAMRAEKNKLSSQVVSSELGCSLVLWSMPVSFYSVIPGRNLGRPARGSLSDAHHSTLRVLHKLQPRVAKEYKGPGAGATDAHTGASAGQRWLVDPWTFALTFDVRRHIRRTAWSLASRICINAISRRADG